MHYHARDMAVVRGHIARIPVVLASATPSVETEVNARRGRYRRLALPDRFGGQRCRRSRPSICASSGRRPAASSRRCWPVPCKRLERREQALLFLNRRGYAPLTLCRNCGFRFSCPNCDAWLVDHRFRKQLVCHHCGFAMPHPHACPKCHADEFLCRLRTGRGAARRRGADAVSRGAHSGAVERSRRFGRAHARGIRRNRRRPLRHRDRHAACRQGPPLPDAQSGRRRSTPISA